MPFDTDNLLDGVLRRIEVATQGAEHLSRANDKTGALIALARAAELAAFGNDLAEQAQRTRMATEFADLRRATEAAIRELL